MDWNGQENFSLSCMLWVGTNDFNAKEKLSCPFQSTDNFPEWKLAFSLDSMHGHSALQKVKRIMIRKKVHVLEVARWTKST